MPQTTVQNVFKAEYPITAPAQKPGGVTISTTLWTHAVPNKPQWTGTQGLGVGDTTYEIQGALAQVEGLSIEGASAGVSPMMARGAPMAASVEPTEEAEETEEEEEEPPPRPRGRRR